MHHRKTNSLLIVLALMSVGFSGLLAIQSVNIIEPAEAISTRAFAGGDGTIGDPYQISNVDQLQDIGSDLTAHYVLINDIDASSTVGWNSNAGFVPIGDSTNKFTGSLDGQGYKITDLFINRTSTNYVGLFGYLDIVASLSNISLIDNSISGYRFVGGPVGFNRGTLSNCYATGNVSGINDYIGGLIGENHGSVSNCYSTGNIGGEENVGGLVGDHYDNTISNCYATGSVSGIWCVGGLVGQNYGGSVSNCYATGSANGIDKTGGLMGINEGTVSNCYATGNVSGDDDIGGLMGGNDHGTVDNCYATGKVSGTGDNIGGLVGENYQGTISDCYATGSVSGNGDVGGLVGYNEYSTVSNCFASGNASGIGYNIGGLTGENSGSVSNCFATGSVSGTGKIGGLVGENYLGTISDCYATGSVSGTGNLVGGLVGVNSMCTISNCSASGNVSGENNIGGLLGYGNGGMVSNCYAIGSVSGTDNIGGLLGFHSDSTASNCYATGSVTGANYIGGLLGYNKDSSTVSNCYSTGSVSGTDSYLGGLVGFNDGSSIVENCFWDTETSGMADSDGGTEKITSEMKQGVTFTGAGWNFVDTWSLIEGKTYPYLNNITYPSPIITTVDVINCVEDQAYLVEYTGESFLPGCTDLTWEIDTDATWLTMSADGVLSGTPLNEDVGNHAVEVICKDLRLVSTARSFTLSVLNTNDAPEIDLTYTNATEDVLYSMALSAIDIDPVGDILNWTLESGPTWLELNTTTNTLNGTPLNSDVGINEVNVSVDDGNGGSDWQNFTIIVENTNDDPIIITTPMNTTLQDELYSVLLNATDEDPVAINFTWSMDTNAGWLELNGTSLTGTPDNSDVGTFWVNITVIDGYGGSHSLNYTLIVSNVNDAPIWTITPIDQNITEGEEMSLECAATDIDGDNITYSIETTPTSDITIDSGTGVISWASPVVGTYTATVTASDGTIEIIHTFSLTVYAPGDEPEPVENKTDTDGDGMPDEWELKYGFDPDDPTDAALDSDGDGISNLDEYKQGSDPTVNESVDGSTDTDDKRSYAGFCLIVGIIGIILLLIMVVIIVLVVRSRKGQTDSLEE